MNTPRGVWLDDLTRQEAASRFDSNAVVVIPVAGGGDCLPAHLPLKSPARDRAGAGPEAGGPARSRDDAGHRGGCPDSVGAVGEIAATRRASGWRSSTFGYRADASLDVSGDVLVLRVCNRSDADDFATSCLMALDPRSVRMPLLPAGSRAASLQGRARPRGGGRCRRRLPLSRNGKTSIDKNLHRCRSTFAGRRARTARHAAALDRRFKGPTRNHDRRRRRDTRGRRELHCGDERSGHAFLPQAVRRQPRRDQNDSGGHAGDRRADPRAPCHPRQAGRTGRRRAAGQSRAACPACWASSPPPSARCGSSPKASRRAAGSRACRSRRRHAALSAMVAAQALAGVFMKLFGLSAFAAASLIAATAGAQTAIQAGEWETTEKTTMEGIQPMPALVEEDLPRGRRGPARAPALPDARRDEATWLQVRAGRQAKAGVLAATLTCPPNDQMPGVTAKAEITYTQTSYQGLGQLEAADKSGTTVKGKSELERQAPGRLPEVEPRTCRTMRAPPRPRAPIRLFIGVLIPLGLERFFTRHHAGSSGRTRLPGHRGSRWPSSAGRRGRRSLSGCASNGPVPALRAYASASVTPWRRTPSSSARNSWVVTSSSLLSRSATSAASARDARRAGLARSPGPSGGPATGRRGRSVAGARSAPAARASPCGGPRRRCAARCRPTAQRLVGRAVVAQHDAQARHAFMADHADFDAMVGMRGPDDRNESALNEMNVGDRLARRFEDLLRRGRPAQRRPQSSRNPRPASRQKRGSARVRQLGSRASPAQEHTNTRCQTAPGFRRRQAEVPDAARRKALAIGGGSVLLCPITDGGARDSRLPTFGYQTKAGMTCSPKRRIEARFWAWLIAPKPVWQSRCCTPTSRSSATCSRTRLAEP